MPLQLQFGYADPVYLCGTPPAASLTHALHVALVCTCAGPQAALLRTGIPTVQVTAADGDAEGELEVDGDDTTPLDGSRAPTMVTVHRV